MSEVELSPEELDSIAKLCESQTYKRNDVIFTEKSHGKELFVVAKGRVRIELEIKGEAEKATVHRVQPGGVFGELAFGRMDYLPYSYPCLLNWG